MPPRTNSGSLELGNAIRNRRIELNLTIEEAATKAGTGTKTWGRYESGAAIRTDKIRGLCKALGWNQLPNEEDLDADDTYDAWLNVVDNTHEAWSKTLEQNYGRACAVSFAVGYDLLSNHADEDLTELAKLPRGTHIGELGVSWLEGSLPPQFLTRYDYEFVYSFKQTLDLLRKRFVAGDLRAESVIEELAIFLIFGEAAFLADMYPEFLDEGDYWEDWVGGILDDLDVKFFLFSPSILLTPRMNYHFDHWDETQFDNEDGLTSSERIAEALGGLRISESNADDK
jgi:transcriptional regulator with XRE-family HTH domain